MIFFDFFVFFFLLGDFEPDEEEDDEELELCKIWTSEKSKQQNQKSFTEQTTHTAAATTVGWVSVTSGIAKIKRDAKFAAIIGTIAGFYTYEDDSASSCSFKEINASNSAFCFTLSHSWLASVLEEGTSGSPLRIRFMSASYCLVRVARSTIFLLPLKTPHFHKTVKNLDENLRYFEKLKVRTNLKVIHQMFEFWTVILLLQL